jgi:hypothetical protein
VSSRRMTLRSSASRGGKSGTHLVTVAGEQVGVDDRVEQVRPVYRTGRGSGPGRQVMTVEDLDPPARQPRGSSPG